MSIADALSRSESGSADAVRAVSGDLTYGAELLERRQVPGVGKRRRLAETTGKVLAPKKQMPDLVILPAHDPTAAARLLGT